MGSVIYIFLESVRMGGPFQEAPGKQRMQLQSGALAARCRAARSMQLSPWQCGLVAGRCLRPCFCPCFCRY